jgi:hypothetical protein
MNFARANDREEKARRPSKGDRVHLSELGCARHPRNSGKEGTVVGHTQYPNSLRIVWDGSRWPITMHRDYLQLAGEDVSYADGRSRYARRG